MKQSNQGTKIYLVPGFFGFKRLGAYSYFHQVVETLGNYLSERGMDAEIIEVDTIPTGSIRRRARKLIETVIHTDGHRSEHLHFVGHSAGGLDIRMMLSPNVTITESDQERLIANKTRSVITLATPHFGTPMANFFTSMNGQKLLLLLCLMATTNPGRQSIYYSGKMLSTFARMDKWLGQRFDIIDDVSARLLNQLNLDGNDEIWQYLQQIQSDQGAMIQLTPEAMDLFNGAVRNHPDIAYRSFVTAAPKPKLGWLLPDPGNIYRSLTHFISPVKRLKPSPLGEQIYLG